MLRILVVDDFPVVRQGVVNALKEEGGFSQIDEANNGQEALAMIRDVEYDVVISDISMPGKGGIELLKEIKAFKPSLPVLMLSMHPEDQYAVRAIKAGAAGYISKTCEPQELTQAILKVSQGGKYLTPAVAESLAMAVGHPGEGDLHAQLSDREFEVMCKIGSGRSVSDIAEDMNLSVKTISTYRSRILEKMNMRHNAELTRYVIEKNLI